MANEPIRILVVEDESSIRKFIVINLKRHGFDAFEAESGEEALKQLDLYRPNIVVLDVMLPGIDGYEACRRIREQARDVAIIMLTARGEDMDKIMGLELGADDYMVKPFNPFELVARIRAILRRTEVQGYEAETSILYSGGLSLDTSAQCLKRQGEEIELTPREYAILKHFMQNPGKAMSRDELLNTVWGRNFFGDVKTVDVHIRRLREKIEEDPAQPRNIETVWGYGYRWKASCT